MKLSALWWGEAGNVLLQHQANKKWLCLSAKRINVWEKKVGEGKITRQVELNCHCTPTKRGEREGLGAGKAETVVPPTNRASMVMLK